MTELEIEQLKEEIIRLKNELERNCIYIDPEKRDLLSIIDDDGYRFTYSNKQPLIVCQNRHKHSTHARVAARE